MYETIDISCCLYRSLSPADMNTRLQTYFWSSLVTNFSRKYVLSVLRAFSNLSDLHYADSRSGLIFLIIKSEILVFSMRLCLI